MSKKKKSKKKKSNSTILLQWTFLSIKFILTIPFYILKFAIDNKNKYKKKKEKSELEEKRSLIKPKYTKFSLIKKTSGDFQEWEKQIETSESTIGIILGARGTGKSALAIKIFENLYKKKRKKLYAIGFKKETMPSWINTIDSIDKVTNNSHILIDEGGVLFNSRQAMSKPNKLLSSLMLIARHKNLSIIFISQNSSNLEINILRQADFLLLKPSSLLQKNFERKIIKDLYTETQKEFDEYKEDKGLLYIHSDKFTGFISNTLPSFWNTSISKSWKEK